MNTQKMAQFISFKKAFFIALLVFSFSIIFVDSAKAADWKKTPAQCPSVYEGYGQTGGPGEGMCGVLGNTALWFSTSSLALLVPTSSTSTNNTPGVNLGGYVVDCQAYDANPLPEGPFCDNNTNFWCSPDTSCNNIHVKTVCSANKWAIDSGAFSCMTPGAAPSSTGCVTGYTNCSDITAGCETQINVTGCTDPITGNPGKLNGSCVCIPDPPKTFLTGSTTIYSSPNPLLWGQQNGDGDLIRFTNNKVSTSSFVVFNSGQVAIGHNINVSTTSVAFEVSSTDRGILIPRLGSNIELDSFNNIDGHLYYNTTTHKFRYYNNTTWSDLGGGLPSGSIGQILVNNGGENWVTSSVIYVNTSTGNVGIGTNSPTTRLHVEANGTGDSFAITNNIDTYDKISFGFNIEGSYLNGDGFGNDRAFLITNNSGYYWAKFGIDGTAGIGQNFTNNGYAINVDEYGKVGIGTAYPSTLLTIIGTSTLHHVIPDMTGGSGNVSLYSLGASTTRWNSIWANTYNIGSSTWSITQSGTRFGIFDNAGGTGNERLSILANGNVGIGTTSPYKKLHLVTEDTYDFFISRNLDQPGITMGMSSDIGGNWNGNMSIYGYGDYGPGSETIYFQGLGGSGYFDGGVTVGTSSYVSLNNDGSILAKGIYGSGWDGGSLGEGSRMMWIPKTSSFRAGYAGGTEWNSENIGLGSVSFGIGNISSGQGSFTAGQSNIVLAAYSVIVGGWFNSSTAALSFIGAGFSNSNRSQTAGIVAGVNNIIAENSTSSFIGAGEENAISGLNNVSIVGGYGNQIIYADEAFIGGGKNNLIWYGTSVNSAQSSIVGGYDNELIGPYNFIGGGRSNGLAGQYSVIGGGFSNEVSGDYSFVGGGRDNNVSGDYSFVGGGRDNNVSGDYSSSLGRGMTVSGDYSLGINLATSASYSLSNNNTMAVMGGNVGIGTTSPLSALHISSNNTSESNYGSNLIIQNLASGSDAEAATMFRTGSTPPGQYWWAGVNGGSGFSIALGSVFRGSSTTIHMTPELDVGIGTTEPSTKLHVVGGARITGLGGGGNNLYVCVSNEGVLSRSVSACSGSDIRLKTDIVNITAERNVLEDLSQIRGVYHYWNISTYGENDGRRQVGVIAQELELVLPELVYTDASTTYKSVDYPKLTTFLIEVAKAQQAEIEALREVVSTTLSVQQSGGQLTYSGGDLDLQNYALLNVKNIVSTDNKWAIDENGQFITRIQTSGGNTKEMFAMQSPYSEFVFSSSSELINGEAIINFDPDTCELIDEAQPLKVNITLTGECGGIFVKEKSATGFVVKELNGGTSTSTFDWMVIAKRKFVVAPPPTPPQEGGEGEVISPPLQGGEEGVVETPPTIEEIVTSTPEIPPEPPVTEPTTTPEVSPEPPVEEETPPVEEPTP